MKYLNELYLASAKQCNPGARSKQANCPIEAGPLGGKETNKYRTNKSLKQTS